MKIFRCSVQICLLFAAAASLAQVPGVINYQGRLVSGTNLVNQSTPMVFRLYDTDTGGTPVYVETQTVQVVDGLYSVSFGGAPGQVTLREAVAHQPLFLEVQIAGTVLSPRERIASAPYALASAGMPWMAVTGTSRQAECNCGYIANNASLVTVTLPTNPLVGDIVRVSGAGGGGWKLAQNAGQCVAVGNLNASSDASWAAVTGLGVRAWRALDSSADGTKWCAAANSDYLFTSSDSGRTWTNRESTRVWRAMACSGDGSVILATVNGGYLYVSYDGGSSWTSRMTDASRYWVGAAVSYNGRRMAANVWGESSGGFIYTSSDSGSNWTARATDATRKWNGLACSSNGMTLLAGNYSGYLYTSWDGGVTWTARTAVGSGQWWGCASSADGTKLIAGPDYSGNWLVRSSDGGTSWTTVASSGAHEWECVASSADGNTLLAGDFDAAGMLYRTTDGGTGWDTASGVSTGEWIAAGSSADGSMMMAARNNGYIYTLSDQTSDTTTPGPTGYLQGPQFSAVELQYVGNGTWLPLSYSGALSAH